MDNTVEWNNEKRKNQFIKNGMKKMKKE